MLLVNFFLDKMAFKSNKQRKAFFAKKDNIRADIVPKVFPSGQPISQNLRRQLWNEFKRVEKKNKRKF